MKLFKTHEERMEAKRKKLNEAQSKREKVEEIADIDKQIEEVNEKIIKAKGESNKKSGIDLKSILKGIAKETIIIGESLDKGLGKPMFKNKTEQDEPPPFKLNFKKRI